MSIDYIERFRNFIILLVSLSIFLFALAVGFLKYENAKSDSMMYKSIEEVKKEIKREELKLRKIKNIISQKEQMKATNQTFYANYSINKDKLKEDVETILNTYFEKSYRLFRVNVSVEQSSEYYNLVIVKLNTMPISKRLSSKTASMILYKFINNSYSPEYYLDKKGKKHYLKNENLIDVFVVKNNKRYIVRYDETNTPFYFKNSQKHIIYGNTKYIELPNKNVKKVLQNRIAESFNVYKYNAKFNSNSKVYFYKDLLTKIQRQSKEKYPYAISFNKSLNSVEFLYAKRKN